MRLSIVLRALVIAFVACAVIGEEAAIHKEKNQFQSDAAKMLDIVIRSLYVDQTVFLREIISNASDALDKIRMLYLTNPKEPKNDAGEAPTMDIRISVDKDKRTIYMRDGGVGMTKDELKNNLGSLGSSGTQRFLEQVKDGEKLIGQFGVGFYSVFLVAERVKVASKSDDSDKQWVWESTGDGTYYTYEDPRGNTLGRGTELQLELKSDADQFLENEKLKEIVHRHSEFIHFPIFIKTTKIERVPKKKDSDAEKPKEDEAEVKDEGESEGEDADKKKEEEYDHVPVDSWELVNENKPIWTRKTSEVTEEDYNKFYKALTKDYEDPMFYTHFSVEGEVEFKSILFIPGRAPYNVFDTSVSSNNIRLYVRRVFITDEFKDLLPRYLNFVKGVVDSDDLPLVVSREQLQESRVLKIIKKKLVRKALTMFSDIAESDKKIEAAKEKKDGEAAEHKDTEKDAEDVAIGKVLKEVTFPKLWEEFGKNLRLGLIEDGTNRARLTKLLRYKTSKSEDKLVSLQDYVDRMPESQKNIYFLSDESVERIKQNPVLEDALKRDVEVIYMTDAIDEYVVGHVTDYSGKKLVNLAKEGISLSDRSASEKNIAKARKAKYEPLTKWFKDLLGDKVTKVTLTQRKTSEPVILTSPQHGTTVRMHKLMQAQTLGEKATEKSPKRVMEINHLHPLVDEVFKRISVDPKDKIAEDLSLVLFDVANLQNGFPVDDTLVFGQRVGRMLRQSVDIAPDAPLLEEDVSQYETEAAEEEGDDDAEGRKGDDEKKDEL